MQLFDSKDNLNSIVQFGTGIMPFGRCNDSGFQWKYRPPYVKYGDGFYDVSQEFQNPGLYGVPADTTKAFKLLSLAVPVSMGIGAAGFAYGISKKSFGKAILFGTIGGLLPISLAWINLLKS